jgi:nicotinate-nucleotide pyrophosphorylase (carboxylating)
MAYKLSDIERQRIRIALVEDAGKGDPTTYATIPEEMLGTGTFLAKADGIVAGLDVARHAFLLYEVQHGISSPIFEYLEVKKDGDQVAAGETLATVRAQMRTLLTAERVALNLLQRMSGIATLTRRFVDAVAGTGATILDTRKTAPLLRPFDRYAVRIGGGMNHRYSLGDMILVKDNHIAANGGDIARVLHGIQHYFEDPSHEAVPVEIEVTSVSQLELLLRLGKGLVQRVLFDNFTIESLKHAVDVNAGTFETEASGGVTLETVRQIAETGVDYISVGALTHSIQAFDISLEIQQMRDSSGTI